MLTSAKQQARDLSKKIVRQIAQEPLEVLKSARGQLSGEQIDYYQERIKKDEQVTPPGEDKTKEIATKEKAQTSRTLIALERELEDIRLGKLFNELQGKIAQGEEVYLEDNTEISPEQKQVLKAQMEAVKIQKINQTTQEDFLVQPNSKRARGSWMQGGKSSAEKQQTRVEKPVPPSG